VQPQIPTTDRQADIDSIDDHDETPQNTLTTWVLGLLFALVISWLPAATETTPKQMSATQVVDHHHRAAIIDLSTCMTPGQEGNMRARFCSGNDRMDVSVIPIFLPTETASP